VQMGRGDDVPTCFHWDPSSCAMPFPLLCLAVPLITMKHEDEEGDLRKKFFCRSSTITQVQAEYRDGDGAIHGCCQRSLRKSGASV